MKFCLKNRQSVLYLKKADEICIEYRDRRAIPDYAKKYPNATLTLEILPQTEWDFSELKEYFILSRNKLKFCLPEIKEETVSQFKTNNMPFFWGYEITTAYELNAVIAAGVCEARIGAPLFFDTDYLKKCGIPLRVTANVAHAGYFEHLDGINGSWIRPEDLDMYEGIFTTVEFADCDQNKEQALFRIYAEQKKWPGRVDMLISNIEAPEAYNRMLPPEFTSTRLNCRQRCASGGACRICYRYMSLADPDKIKAYAEHFNLN